MYYYVTPTDDDLQHHGRLNQRWGIKNGPPYPLSRKTVSKVYGKNPLKEAEDSRKTYGKDPLKRDRGRVDVGKVKPASDSVRVAASAAKNLKRDLKRSTPKKREDLTKMSDQELRDAINRMRLEDDYNRLKNSREVSRGSEFVDKALDVGGDTALLAGSIASIILLFKKAS